MSDPKAAIDAVLDGTARYAVLCGDATEVMKIVPSETIHVSYNDPPYGLSEQTTESVIECLRAWLDGKVYTHNRQGFMGKEWDAYVPGPEAWREVNRVLKPGGYNVSFSSTRTVDLLGMAIRLAGFELRQGFCWISGQGFPKSLDVARAIDERSASDVSAMRQWVKSLGTREDIAAAAGVTPRQVDHWIGENTPCPQMLTGARFAKLCEAFDDVPEWADKMFPSVREVVGKIRHARSGGDDFGKLIGAASSPKVVDVTAPSSDAAKRWDGYGTDVKPAYEPLVVARKSMDGTVASNVLAHGCGVLNIDAARIGTESTVTRRNGDSGGVSAFGKDSRVGQWTNPPGRFPAALALVHDEDCELVGMTKVRGDARQGGGSRPGGFVNTGASKGSKPCAPGYADPDGIETVDEWRCTETCAVAELARQSNDAGVHGAGSARGGGLGDHDRVSMFVPNAPNNGMRYGDFGSAARFFYQAKASASDRLAYMTCSDGCKHNDRAAWLKDARASVRDGRQEPIGGKCIDVDVAAPAAHAAITTMFVREVLDEVLGITRQALGEDVVSSGSTCIDATLVTNAVASAMADQNSDEIAAALAERGTALAPRTSLCARSSTSAEGESQEDSTCVPRNDDNADPAWPSHGFCRSCGAPRTNYQHPTVKPQSLANWHAKLLSLPTEVSPVAVVPFCGTGIEAKALLDAGFRVIAIDIDPRHVTMTEFRLANGAPDEARTTTRSDSPVRPMPSKPTKVLRGKPAKQTDTQLDLFGKKP